MASNLDLVTWIVSNKRADSLDLLMTSHPSTSQMYWMLSRTMFELEKARLQNTDTYWLLKHCYSDWNITVRHYVTEAILNVIQDGGLDGKGNPLAYVDDILPPVTDASGKEEPIGNDRLFATATAASSLIAAWTMPDKQTNLLFLPDTPADVALATKSLVNYVISRYPSKEESLMNVFHSTIYKHCPSLAFYFPANAAVTRNGSEFPTTNTTTTTNAPGSRLPTPDVLFGMRGLLSASQYQTLLLEPHYGQQTPVGGPQLPAPSDTAAAPFFVWSAPVYSRAMSLLAVGQMKNVNGKASDWGSWVVSSVLQN